MCGMDFIILHRSAVGLKIQKLLIEDTCQPTSKDWEKIIKKMKINSNVTSAVIWTAVCE